MPEPRTMSLALLVDQATGNHPASWLAPETNAAGSTDIGHYRALAQLAERGKFDLFFIADTPATRTENFQAWSRFPMYMNALEPVTLLTALAGATSRIGLGGTVSTSFSEPYNVARQFASLDHISAGRAAWNVVTSANDYAARNFVIQAIIGQGYSTGNDLYQAASRNLLMKVSLPNVVAEFSDPTDPNTLVSDAVELLFGITVSQSVRNQLKTSRLLLGQQNDMYWTDAYEIYAANPNTTDQTGQMVPNLLLYLFLDMGKAAETQVH